jgi:superfamily I DNA/RNA helicase
MKQTPQQALVIETYRKGLSQAVSARAGSGKTSTLVEALQASPPGTLAVAFNKRTADELQARMPPAVLSKTLNSLGHSAWGRHTGKRLVLDTKKLIKLLQSHPKAKLFDDNFMEIVKLVRLAKASGLSSGFQLREPDFEDWLSIADAHDVIEPEGLLEPAAWLLKENCRQAFQGTIDFDDQIYCSVMYGSPFTRYASVAVDEAQDLSPLQHRMIERSLSPGAQLTIVGDPAQAIYGFRGASLSSFDDFIEKFSLEANPLTASFRCPRAVIREAQRFVPDIEAASEREGMVSRLRGEIEPRANVTVLSRTNAPLLKLAFQCLRARVAPNMLGRDFLSGLKALNKKYPTLETLERWHAAEMISTNDAKKSRASDRYEAMIILHEEGDVEASIAKISAEAKTAAMTLSTIHKSKGLEWDNVIYYDFEKEWKGSQENNIKYTGLTRSKDKLYLHSP